MGRPSACSDSSLWPDAVRDFLARRAKKNGNEALHPEPDRRLIRSKYERRIRVLVAQRGDVHSPNAASAVLAYWQWSLRQAHQVDPVVLDYLEWARRRYCADPRRDIAKALGLVLPTAGAPGVLMHKNKSKGSAVKATPDALLEAVLMYEELRRDRDPKKRLHKNAVEAVIKATGISRPVLLKAAAKRRLI